MICTMMRDHSTTRNSKDNSHHHLDVNTTKEDERSLQITILPPETTTIEDSKDSLTSRCQDTIWNLMTMILKEMIVTMMMDTEIDQNPEEVDTEEEILQEVHKKVKVSK